MQSPFAFARSDLAVVSPKTADEAAGLIREAAAAKRAVLARGGGTKWSIGRQPVPGVDALVLDTTGLSGIIEYDPGELTLTAKAGTPLAEVEAALATNGQYLPFDPPFVEQGATLGGTIAAGLSGSRRMRYGGLRDFVIGVEYLGAAGTPVKGGGKVVKNAAGYDLPKLFCGSLGTLGVLVKVSFKVFPHPQSHQTLIAGLKDARSVQAVMLAIQRSTIEVSAADAWPAGTVPGLSELASAFVLAVQLSGPPQSLPPRLETLKALLPPGTRTALLPEAEAAQLWLNVRDAAWIGDEAESVVRLYLQSNRLADLDTSLAERGARRVYSVAGNLGWAAFSGAPSDVAPALAKLGVRAAVWRTKESGPEILPELPGAPLVKRIKKAFDANNLFYPGRYAAG